MSDLRPTIQAIQKEVGAVPDGVFGPVTAGLVLHQLQNAYVAPAADKLRPAGEAAQATFDARSEAVLATLDPKAVPLFRQFLALAKASAATLGCDYVLISGNRTFAEQDALYAQGRTKPGKIVTKARGGQSNHNFGIAADAGVFQGKVYLDDGTPEQWRLASKVHKACSMHAAACGLEWGGSWSAIKDEPHFEVATGLSLAEKRQKFEREGSVL